MCAKSFFFGACMMNILLAIQVADSLVNCLFLGIYLYMLEYKACHVGFVFAL